MPKVFPIVHILRRFKVAPVRRPSSTDNRADDARSGIRSLMQASIYAKALNTLAAQTEQRKK